eukprot:Rmarinus@m.10023
MLQQATRARDARPNDSLMDNVSTRLSQFLEDQLVGIPDTYPLRHRLKIYLYSSTVGHWWDVIQTVLSLLSCVLYVLETYELTRSVAMELILSLAFTLDYVFRWFIAKNRLVYPFTFPALVDALTVIPVYLEIVEKGGTINLSFIRVVRVLRVLRILRTFKILNSLMSGVKQQVVRMVLTAASIIFLSAGLVHMAEHEFYDDRYCCDGPFDQECDPKSCPNIETFGQALYFTIVTMSTVGYGDFTPVTILGKIFMCSMIIISIAIVPQQASRLMDLMNLQSAYSKKFHVQDNEHVIVTGYLDTSVLRDFFEEFYHPDRLGRGELGKDPVERAVVILGAEEPTDQMKGLLHHPMLEGRVQYVKGSVLRDLDLFKCGADHALACFIFTDKHTASRTSTDRDSLIRALALENFNAKIDTYVQVLRHKNVSHAIDAGVDEVLCVGTLKSTVLARSCLCPGLSTIFTLLCRTFSEPDRTVSTPWLMEYKYGCAKEVYLERIPGKFRGYPIGYVAKYLFLTNEVMFIGIEISVGKSGKGQTGADLQNSAVILNPSKSMRIQRNMKGFFVASSVATVREAFERFSKEEHNLYKELQVLQPSPLMGAPIPPSSPVSDRASPTHSYSMSPGSVFRQRVPIMSFHKAGFLGESTRGRSRSVSVDHLSTCSMNPEHRSSRVREAVWLPIRTAYMSDEVLAHDGCPEVFTPDVRARGLKSHVIVCGYVGESEGFVNALRRESFRGSAFYKPIVILDSFQSTSVGYAKKLRAFDDVYLVPGDPTNVDDLIYAGVQHASSCVILMNPRDGKHRMDGETLDPIAVFTYLNVEEAAKALGIEEQLFILVELSQGHSIRLMNSKLVKSRTGKSTLAFQDPEIAGLNNMDSASDSSHSESDCEEINSDVDKSDRVSGRGGVGELEVASNFEASGEGATVHLNAQSLSSPDRHHLHSWNAPYNSTSTMVSSDSGTLDPNVHVTVDVGNTHTRTPSSAPADAGTLGLHSARGRDGHALESNNATTTVHSPTGTASHTLAIPGSGIRRPGPTRADADADVGPGSQASNASNSRSTTCRSSDFTSSSSDGSRSSMSPSNPTTPVEEEGWHQILRSKARRLFGIDTGGPEGGRKEGCGVSRGGAERIARRNSFVRRRKARDKKLKRMAWLRSRAEMKTIRFGSVDSEEIFTMFSSGFAFSSDAFDSLLCQVYYNRSLIRFLNYLVEKAAITRVPIPPQFVEKTFRELYLHYNESMEDPAYIPIALYRHVEAARLYGGGNLDVPDATLPYVYMAPHAHTILHPKDLVFLLGSEPTSSEVDVEANVSPSNSPRPRRPSTETPCTPCSPRRPPAEHTSNSAWQVSSPSYPTTPPATPTHTHSQAGPYADPQLLHVHSSVVPRAPAETTALAPSAATLISMSSAPASSPGTPRSSMHSLPSSSPLPHTRRLSSRIRTFSAPMNPGTLVGPHSNTEAVGGRSAFASTRVHASGESRGPVASQQQEKPDSHCPPSIVTI